MIGKIFGNYEFLIVTSKGAILMRERKRVGEMRTAASGGDDGFD
jgi:hypothetical protein